MSLIIGFVAAAFMLYFPYLWCRFRGESELDWGLKWFLTRESKRDVIFALIITLVPLTFVSMNFPVEWGGGNIPHKLSFWVAIDNLGGGIAAAFIEETFYRGWLQSFLARKMNVYIAIVITALIFALSHLILITGWLRVATFFPGLVMGWLRFRGGSILPSIIYHAVCNVWAVWFAPIP